MRGKCAEHSRPQTDGGPYRPLKALLPITTTKGDPMRTILVLTFLVSALPAGGLTATVNDAASHGAVGDVSLSLDEAIRLANGTLSLGALSAAERARIVGSGTAVDRIVIEQAVTPLILLQAELTELRGIGGSVQITGVAGLQGNRPIIDAASFSAAFKVRTPRIEITSLALRNGRVGIDVETGTGAPGNAAQLRYLEFTQQSEAGLRLRTAAAPLGQSTAVLVERVSFSNLPIGYDVLDSTRGGSLSCVSEWVYMFGVPVGVNLVTDAFDGTSSLEFWRSDFFNGDTFVRVQRSPASNQRQIVKVVHGEYESHRDLVDVQGNAFGDTVLEQHHCDYQAAPGFKAFHVHPRTARFAVNGSEMTLLGDIAINADRNSPGIRWHNSRFRDGRITFDVEGAPPDLLWNKITNCTVETLAGNRSPVVFVQSELHQTQVIGGSLIGTISLNGCFRRGGSVQGSASESNSAASAWIGDASVSTEWVRLGTPLILDSTLPLGMAGVWLIGLSASRPLLATFPYRFYFEPTPTVVLRGVLIGTSRLSLPIPNQTALFGYEYYAQMFTTPISGQTHVPAVNLPIGATFRVVP